MNTYDFKKGNETSVAMAINGVARGCLRAYVIRPGNDNCFHPRLCQVTSVVAGEARLQLRWQSEDEGVSAALDLKPHTVGYSGVFRASGRGHAVVRLVWELPHGERGFPLVPAFMYGGNEGGKSPRATYPQLGNENRKEWAKPWIADEWLVRTDRSSHGLTSVIANRWVYAIGGRDVCRYRYGKVADKTGIGISNIDPHKLSFSLGFINWPYAYSCAPGRNWCRPDGHVNLDAGEVSTEIFIFLFEHEGRQEAAAGLLRHSYACLHDSVTDVGGIDEAVGAIADTLVDYGYCEKARNFHTALYADNRLTESLLGYFSSAWAGGLRTAYPLLVVGHQMNKARWLDCAREIFSNMAAHAMSNRSGLFNDNYDLKKNEWSARGWWYPCMEKPGHSGYVNGQMCHYMLLAYVAEKEAGVERGEWFSAAKRVLDHVAGVQGKDGRFGYTYSEQDGTILDEDGFSGCWFTPAFATLYRITGDRQYLDVARRAMDFYRQDVEAFHVYGGPHDIFKSPDEEGILSWIEAARLLHEATREERFLKDLLTGLDYEFSWKFAYNVVNEVEPLKSKNWCSTGGSVTSVNNSHIHPMGSQVAGSILYATEATGDEYLRSRLIDTVRWTLTVYLHYDGDYGWGKKGMINERFCYTDSLICERFPDGSPAGTWFCAHSWASGAVLEGLVGRILEARRKGSKHLGNVAQQFSKQLA